MAISDKAHLRAPDADAVETISSALRELLADVWRAPIYGMARGT
jgi:hypothetical protein